jgi:hypothetical protein
MDPIRPLAPCLIGSGTLTNPRDMVRALETLENLDYDYEIDGTVVSQGKATLVKLMVDSDSSTIVVNGCLFLNVSSFRYLDFATEDDGTCMVRLFGDGTALTLIGEPEGAVVPKGQLRLLEENAFGLESYVFEDDEDD